MTFNTSHPGSQIKRDKAKLGQCVVPSRIPPKIFSRFNVFMLCFTNINKAEECFEKDRRNNKNSPIHF